MVCADALDGRRSGYWTVIRSVPVFAVSVAVIVAVPAPTKLAVPLLAEGKLTTLVVSDCQVTAPLAPLAVNVVFEPLEKTT